MQEMLSREVHTICRGGGWRDAAQVVEGFSYQSTQISVPIYVRLLEGFMKLKALQEGRRVQAPIMQSTFPLSSVLGSLRIRMFSKCGSVRDARNVFDEVPEKDAFSWTAIMAASGKGGQSYEAVKAYHQMVGAGLRPNKYTFLNALEGCAKVGDVDEGIRVEDEILKNGLGLDVALGNALGHMYLKCGSLKDAEKRFDRMKEYDVGTWSAMTVPYVQHRKWKEALRLYTEMKGRGCRPSKGILASIVRACANLQALEMGRQIHADVMQSVHELDVFIGSALVDMYCKCGRVEDARMVFDTLPARDLVVWSAMMSGYAKQGAGEAALDLCEDMGKAGILPNQYTFVSILQACASLSALERGKMVHGQVVGRGYESDIFVGNALLDMYVKCGSMDDAVAVFKILPNRDVVSWNVMIYGYSQTYRSTDALQLYKQMKEAGIQADKVSFLLLLKACANLLDLDLGRQIHQDMIGNGVYVNLELGNTLIDMYAKCGNLDYARQVLDGLANRDTVSWNVLLAGYVQHGQCGPALELFDEMQDCGTKLNSYSLVSALKACAGIAALEHGRKIHDHILRTSVEVDLPLGSAIVDMYIKCGSIGDARQAFDSLPDHSVVSYTAMIGGYAQHGDGKEAVKVFEEMKQKDIKPDSVTLLCVLKACSHAGLMEVGLRYFHTMAEAHGVAPAERHFACIVDLLCRAGRLLEAEQVVKQMPIPPSAVVWSSLLGACKQHSNLPLGERAFQSLVQLEPNNSGAYATMASMYAAAKRWNDVGNVRNLMEAAGVGREPGYSWIEVSQKMHKFGVRDEVHPQSYSIFAELQKLAERVRQTGYVPDIGSVPFPAGDERKEHALCGHSEKLAMVWGLMNAPPGTPIRVMKNLRTCQDCHTFAKMVSKVESREIIQRDATRFHHFRDGVCSCGDYW